jgi:endonuclease-3
MQHLPAGSKISMSAEPKRSVPAEVRAKISVVERILRRTLGNPALEGPRENPLDVLIATILSQNTNDVNSHKAWLNLKRAFPSWDELLAASPRKLAKTIEVGGLKNQKAAAIRRILRLIKKRTGRYSLRYLKGMSDRDALIHLREFSGVGSKTAACVLVFGLGREVFPVDTHIHRILNRLGIVHTKSPDKTFEFMEELSPPGRAYSFHVNLIRFGRETCAAQKPRCGACVLYEQCEFASKEQFAAEQKRAVSSQSRDFIILHNLKRKTHGRSVDSPLKKH